MTVRYRVWAAWWSVLWARPWIAATLIWLRPGSFRARRAHAAWQQFLGMAADVEVLRLQPDDKLLVKTDAELDMDEWHELRMTVRQVFPDHEILVVSGGVELEIVRET